MMPAAPATRMLSSSGSGMASASAAAAATTAATAGGSPARLHTPANDTSAHASEPTSVFLPASGECFARVSAHSRPAIVAAGSPAVAHQSAAIAALRENTATATRHEIASQVAPVIDRFSWPRVSVPNMPSNAAPSAGLERRNSSVKSAIATVTESAASTAPRDAPRLYATGNTAAARCSPFRRNSCRSESGALPTARSADATQTRTRSRCCSTGASVRTPAAR